MANKNPVRILRDELGNPAGLAEFQPGETIDPAFLPPGNAGQTTYTWNQPSALIVWTIPHNLERYPSVSVVDTLGDKVEPDVRWVDENIVQVAFGAPFAGKAYLN